MITKDAYLLPPQAGNYLSVRHLRLKGSNREIGKNLAELAKKEWGVTLSEYVDAAYAKGRLKYYERNWKTQHDRMLGVADAYGVDANNTNLDLSSLAYYNTGSGCSAIYIPPSLSATGEALLGRNYDWYIVPIGLIMGFKNGENSVRFNSQNQLTEIHPEEGYATIQLSSHDLMNPWLDGFNEHGLFVTVLNDPGAPATPVPHSGGVSSGLSMFQVVGLLTSKCRTVEEAKTELLQHHIYNSISGLHYLIADAHGHATVFEIDGKTGQYYFVDSKPNEPFFITNHALHTFKGHASFPEVDMSKEHDSFTRICILEDYVKHHSGKYTEADLRQMLDEVLCSFVDNTKAGVSLPFPERTLWSYVANIDRREMSLKFYLGDLDAETGTNHLRIRRSEPMTIGFTA